MNKIIYSILGVVVAFASLTAVEPNLMKIECQVRPIDRAKIHPKGKSERFATTSSQTSSSNWSGYVAAPSLQQSVANSVSYAAGSWIVPTLLPTNDGAYCAIWVGIDGFLDGSVEQIGTSHNWINGAQQNYAWFEMYPNGAYEISGFPVDSGDQISVQVAYVGNDTFELVMKNFTQGVSTVIPSSYTTSSTAQRGCAEWVVEAPYANQILPLADFNLATFNYCSAIINGVSGLINDSSWMNAAITMEGQNGVEAQPSSLLKNGSCFQVQWVSE